MDEEEVRSEKGKSQARSQLKSERTGWEAATGLEEEGTMGENSRSRAATTREKAPSEAGRQRRGPSGRKGHGGRPAALSLARPWRLEMRVA